MRQFLILWRRELAGCFLSPVSYVTMIVFLGACGFTFGLVLCDSQGETQPMSVSLYASVLVWCTILITVVSMRLFAEEKRAGTLETLLTAPVTEWQVVMGKFCGALTFVGVACVLACASLEVVRRAAPGVTAVDVGAALTGLVALILICSSCVSLGLFVSTLTRSQVVAALSCFIGIWVFFLLGTLPVGGAAFSGLSVLAHMEEAARGILETRWIVLYVSVTGLFLFSAVRVLEARRWL